MPICMYSTGLPANHGVHWTSHFYTRYQKITAMFDLSPCMMPSDLNTFRFLSSLQYIVCVGWPACAGAAAAGQEEVPARQRERLRDARCRRQHAQNGAFSRISLKHTNGFRAQVSLKLSTRAAGVLVQCRGAQDWNVVWSATSLSWEYSPWMLRDTLMYCYVNLSLFM